MADICQGSLCIVPEDQLSLAIGKNGQNVRLAAHLTGWKIDVRSPEVEEEGKEMEEQEGRRKETEKQKEKKEVKAKEKKKVKKTKKQETKPPKKEEVKKQKKE